MRSEEKTNSLEQDAIGWHSEIAASFESRYLTSRLFKERYAVWEAVVSKLSDPLSAVIDIGCGPGVLTEMVAKKSGSVLAVDASKEMLEICQGRIKLAGSRNVTWQLVNVMEMPLRVKNKYHLALCSSVLEYVDNLANAVWCCAEVLESGGQLVVSMPNRAAIYRKAEQKMFKWLRRPKYFKHVKNVLDASEMKEIMERQGVVVDRPPIYFAKSPFLGRLLEMVGFAPSRCNNLYILVGRKP